MNLLANQLLFSIIQKKNCQSTIQWRSNSGGSPLNLQPASYFPTKSLAEDFTLEKIIDLGLDQFAEQISEVSGAASKELSIEQVGLWLQ